MSSSELAVFFRPHGVAVIGASREPQKLGHGVVRNLKSVHYPGPVYPINPHEEEICGYAVYPTIAAVPDPVDLAIIVVPAPAVPQALEECGKRGIHAAVVVSGGFREVGPEGAAREQEIARLATAYGIRVLGPNCIGTIDAHTPLNTTFVTGMPQPGEIAFVSQSGAMVAAVIDWAAGSGVGFSRIVSLGNQVDVSSAEMLGQIARDGHTRVVTGYLEGVGDGRAFVAAAQEVAQQVPVLFVKAGQGRSGARAVASHTGALAGDLAAYRAAFRRAGILWAGGTEELFDWGRALAWQPLPRGNRVAILTNAGGPAILAADAVDAAGLQLAPLTPETKAFLRRRVFPAASVENPVDVLAGAGPATYALCLDALLADDTVDAVFVIQAPQDWFKPLSLAEIVGEVANSSLGRRKPILTAIMGLASTSEATQILHHRRIPNYAFPERLGSTLGAMWWRKQWLDAHAASQEPAPAPPLVAPPPAPPPDLTPDAAGWLPPDQVRAWLAAYGLATPDLGLARTADEAVALAEAAGYPVVLKLAAAGVTHKTDVGGVVLNLRSAADVRTGFTGLWERAAARLPAGTIQGAQVQRMVAGGVELIVGMVRDAQFGPLVMAGLGGTAVELTRQVDFELAPLARSQAEALLDRTAAGKVLAGFRGAPPADREAVVTAILRLAQMAQDHPTIQELEINPLIVGASGTGAIAVDARLRVTAPAD